MSIDVTSSDVDMVCWGDALGPVMWIIDIFVVMRVWMVGLRV